MRRTSCGDFCERHHQNLTLSLSLFLSLEQYADLDKVSLDEIIGSFKVHELWLKERESHEEEQTLLAKAVNKTKLTSEEESSSRSQGRHCIQYDHGHGQGMKRRKRRRLLTNHLFSTTIFISMAILPMSVGIPKRKQEDGAYVANSAPTLAQTPHSPALAATSSLLMAIEEAQSDFLLQRSEIDHHTSDLWYLDTCATNHITSQRNFFTTLDKLAL